VAFTRAGGFCGVAGAWGVAGACADNPGDTRTRTNAEVMSILCMEYPKWHLVPLSTQSITCMIVVDDRSAQDP
jgi:hypothetical protein